MGRGAAFDAAAKAAHIVAPVFQRQQWMYGSEPDRSVPTEGHLALLIDSLIRDATESHANSSENYGMAGTGRIRVERHTDPDVGIITTNVLLEVGSFDDPDEAP